MIFHIFACGLLIISGTYGKSFRGVDEVDIQCFFDDNELVPSDLTHFGTITPIKAYVWKNGEIPYYFNHTFNPSISKGDKTLIQKAMKLIERRTCFKFLELTSEPHYRQHLEIQIGDPSCEGRGFQAGVSRGGPYKMVMKSHFQLADSPNCIDWTDGILHELMHVMGVMHTQKRRDRDQHITINEDNIKDIFLGRYQYEVCEGCDSYGVEYDCGSIMHYGTATLSKEGKDTMTAIDPSSCELTRLGAAFDGRGASETDWKLLDIVSRKVCSRGPKGHPGHPTVRPVPRGSPLPTESPVLPGGPAQPSPGGSATSMILLGGASGFLPINNVTLVTSSGHVCSLPALPHPLADHFSVLVLNRILTCGGRSRESQTYCWWLDLRDTSKGWNEEIGTDGPKTGSGRSYGSALGRNGEVWVTGGYDGKNRKKSSEILKLGSKSWEVGAQLSRKRYQHCGVTLRNGDVILTGGHDKGDGALDLVERYKWNGGLKEVLPPLNQPRWTHACEVLKINGKQAVLVAGGQMSSRSGGELDSVEMHVLGSGSWSYKRPLPQARRAPSMVVLGGSPILSGGMFSKGPGSKNEVYPSSIVKYNPLNNTWTTVAEIAGKLADHKAVAVPQKYSPSLCK